MIKQSANPCIALISKNILKKSAVLKVISSLVVLMVLKVSKIKQKGGMKSIFLLPTKTMNLTFKSSQKSGN